jgi:nucleotide-binding universal stress UspA family protein
MEKHRSRSDDVMTEKKLFENILVPVDGSASSIAAEEMAATIAKKTASKVTVLHVIQEFRMRYNIPEMHGELEGAVEQQADKIVNSALALFSDEGVVAESQQMTGEDPAETILEFSEKNYGLIIMGVHGENEKDPYTLGSVTKKVITHAKLPVLVTKKSPHLSSMLVCIDGSEQSIAALEFAVRLADKLGSKVMLLNVQNQKLQTTAPKVVEEVAEKIFSNALAAVQKGKVEVKRKLEVGVPSDRIVEVAERGNYDLIVLGKRGLERVKRFLLGSVSDDVIQKAKTSVLLVPTET